MTQGGFPHSSERNLSLFINDSWDDSSLPCLGMLLGSVGFVMLLFYVVQLGTAKRRWTNCPPTRPVKQSIVGEQHVPGIVGNILLRCSTAVLSCTAFRVWVSWTAGNWRGVKEINLPRHPVRTCRICVWHSWLGELPGVCSRGVL